MQTVVSFPYEWSCECGATNLVPRWERGFLVWCGGCRCEAGPFELPAGSDHNGTAGDLSKTEYLVLGELTGSEILARLNRIGDCKKPWTWSEREIALTVALVEAVKSRWMIQESHHRSSLIDRENDAYDLPCDVPSLIESFMALLDRVEQVAAPLTDTPIFRRVHKTLEELPHHVLWYAHSNSALVVQKSLRNAPSSIKLAWYQSLEIRDAAGLKETMEWLASDPAVPERVRREAQQHLDYERRWNESQEEQRRADERETAIVRYVWLAIIGALIGFLTSRRILADDPEVPSFAHALSIGGGFGFLPGFLLFLLAIIRPVPTSTTDSLETRRVILQGLMLPPLTAVCGILIAAIQWIWRSAAGDRIPTDYVSWIGGFTGLIGVMAFAAGVLACVRWWNKSAAA